MSIMLSIGNIFSKSMEIYRNNPIIIVPSLIPFVWLIVMTIALFLAGIDSIVAMGSIAAVPSIVIIVTLLLGIIVSIILTILAEGMTIGMIRDAFEGRKSDLSVAWGSTKVKIGRLIIASIIVVILVVLGAIPGTIVMSLSNLSIIVILGMICLIVIPVILLLLFYFIAQSIMIDDASATGSLGMSYRFFRNNLGDSLIIIIVSMVIALLLSSIPYAGIILMLIASPFIDSLSTILYIDRGGARNL